MPHMTVFRTLETSALTLFSASPVLTGEVTVPADAPDDSLVRMKLDLLPTDRINPLITFRYAIERRVPPNWNHMCGGSWTGHPDVIDPGTGESDVPWCAVNLLTGQGDGGGGRTIRNKRGWKIRGQIVIPTLVLPLTLGWTLDVVQWNDF